MSITIYFFLTSLIALGIWLSIKSFQDDNAEASAQELKKETVKNYLVKLIQLVGILSAIGLSTKIPFIASISQVLEYISLNMDSTWDAVLLVINVVMGIKAIFVEKEVTDAGLIIKLRSGSETSAQSFNSLSDYAWKIGKH